MSSLQHRAGAARARRARAAAALGQPRHAAACVALQLQLCCVIAELQLQLELMRACAAWLRLQNTDTCQQFLTRLDLAAISTDSCRASVDSAQGQRRHNHTHRLLFTPPPHLPPACQSSEWATPSSTSRPRCRHSFFLIITSFTAKAVSSVGFCFSLRFLCIRIAMMLVRLCGTCARLSLVRQL